MKFDNVYYINGTAYAGKSTMVKALAEKHNGIACEENYHDSLVDELDKNAYPCLTYTRDLEDWGDFVRRTPDEYEAWINGCNAECAILEQKILENVAKQGKKVFVDTNIPVDVLHQISDRSHVLIMLTDPEISVRRFFERPDRDKQFLYQLLLKEPEQDKALENFRECLKRINAKENYDAFLHSGFPVLLREEGKFDETLAKAGKIFGL